MMCPVVGAFTAADSTKIVIWSFVLIALIVVAFVAVAKVKQRFREEIDRNPTAASGFTLADLRQMHRDGVLSDEELERAKVRIVEAARRGAERGSGGPERPGPDRGTGPSR